MRLLEELKGQKMYIQDDGLMVRTNSKYEAFSLKNKIERTGYSVDMERNGDGNYIVKIWGFQLRELYLRKDEEKYAI